MKNILLSIPSYTNPGTSFYAFLITLIVVLGIAAIVGIILFIIGLINEGDVRAGSLFLIVISLIVITLPIGILICAVEEDKKYPEWYKSEIVEIQYNRIYSLELHDLVSGNFTLGISTDSYYYFYIKNDQDLYHLEKLKITENTFLKEQDDTTPRIEERKEANSDYIYTVVYVPTGTIVLTNYQVA